MKKVFRLLIFWLKVKIAKDLYMEGLLQKEFKKEFLDHENND